MVASALAQARRGDPTARDTAASVPGINFEDLAFGPGWVTRTVDAIVKVSEGHAELAADEFRSWLDLVADTPIPRPELVPLFPEAVTALAAAGRHSDAATLLDSLNRPGRPDPLASVIEDYGRGVLALGNGETARARSLLERTRVGAEAIDARWLLAQATFSLGQTLHRAGRRSEAAESFTAAAAHFDAMRAKLWAERARRGAEAAVPETTTTHHPDTRREERRQGRRHRHEQRRHRRGPIRHRPNSRSPPHPHLPQARHTLQGGPRRPSARPRTRHCSVGRPSPAMERPPSRRCLDRQGARNPRSVRARPQPHAPSGLRSLTDVAGRMDRPVRRGACRSAHADCERRPCRRRP